MPQVVFHFGDGNLIVEQVLEWETLNVFFAWLAEVIPALEWPQVTLAMTLRTATLGGLVHRKLPLRPVPQQRKRSRPTLARFLKKRLTSGRRRH